MKQFSCGDVVPGCNRAFTATDDDSLFAQIAEHARSDHGMAEIPEDIRLAVQERIVTI
jgi:predicted small metal-binding protein